MTLRKSSEGFGGLRRRKPMRRGGRLDRRTPIRKVNARRRRRLYERNFGDKGDWIRSLPCAVPHCRREDIAAAHSRARGMGGCKGSKKDLAPLCHPHHDEQERGFETFDRKYGVDMRAEAERREVEWQELQRRGES